ncbi:hypothetical protein [Aquitalea palustris]|uniref:hypothetical protein n=1 Tax=Aquitalea palustris TaxID=2480983 RepID=UPI0011C4742C|nr:hypothetical protein [Aquitalea palustris]
MSKEKDFYLFRVDVTTPAQHDWIYKNGNIDRAKILIDATLSVSDLYSRGRNWSLGNYNVSMESRSGLFCIGRSASFRKPSRDNKLGNYNVNIDIKNPFSRVLFDYELGVICIERNYDLSADVERVANMLQKIMSTTPVFVDNGLILSIRAVRDSAELVEKIKSAYLIKKFSIHFTRRNPRNLDKFFHQLPKIQLEEIDGSEGTLSFHGEELNKSKIVAITKSARVASNNVFVGLISEKGGRVINHELNRSPIVRIELSEDFVVESGLSIMRNCYGE